jgi:alpha-amylase
LLRNQSLSDDIAFRFNDTDWQEYPLTAGKFASWLHADTDNTEMINLCVDYETFGLHKQKDTGILRFLEELPGAVLENEQFRFCTPSHVLEDYYPMDIYDVPQPVSWGKGMDMNCGSNRNTMQHNTLKKIYAIENMVMGCCNPSLVETWGQLQAADHFYYMTEEGFANKKYQNPFASAEEAFRNYTNILVDFEITVIRQNIGLSRQKTAQYLPVYTLY